LEQVPREPGVVLHERTELPVRETEADDVGPRGNGGRARTVIDERDLAEVIAARQRRDLASVDGNDGFTGVDDEERGAASTFSCDRVTGGEPALLEHV